jgi:PadR family transcriptional regulator PadR
MSDQLGSLEQQVLLAVLRLHPNAYGLSVREEILKRTDVLHSIGAVYTTLDRLKAKGFIKQRKGEETEVRRNRQKLYFVLTAPGQTALQVSLRNIGSMLKGTRLAGALT